MLSLEGDGGGEMQICSVEAASRHTSSAFVFCRAVCVRGRESMDRLGESHRQAQALLHREKRCKMRLLFLSLFTVDGEVSG